MSVDSSTAEQIAEEGGVEAVLASIEKGGDDLNSESVANGMKMIEAVLSTPKAFNKILSADLVEKIRSIMAKQSGNTEITLSCVRVLEKVAKSEAGLGFMQNKECVESMIGILESEAAQEVLGEEVSFSVVFVFAFGCFEKGKRDILY